MDGLLSSLIVVGLATIGDRIQLLAVLLMARWGRPGPVVTGLIVATIAAQGLSAFGRRADRRKPAAASGAAVARARLPVDGHLVVSARPPAQGRRCAVAAGGVLASAAGFFAVEFGDRTQLATMALAARFDAWELVALGATIGVAVATIPCVLFGQAFLDRQPGRLLRMVAAALFILLGLWTGLDALRLI